MTFGEMKLLVEGDTNWSLLINERSSFVQNIVNLFVCLFGVLLVGSGLQFCTEDVLPDLAKV